MDIFVVVEVIGLLDNSGFAGRYLILLGICLAWRVGELSRLHTAFFSHLCIYIRLTY